MSVRTLGSPGLAPRGANDPAEVARAIDALLAGKSNNLAEVTLTANSATTTFNHPLITGFSGLFFTPLTANAQAIATPRPSNMGTRTCTLNHANDANADKTFKVLIVG